MKVFRFMSYEEFEKYKSGQVLVNNTRHAGKTNSIGFCFLDADEIDIKEALHFLSGIVSFDICAVFETNKKLNKTYGEYAKPIKDYDKENPLEFLINLLNCWEDIPENRMKINEYCTKKYSKADFKLIKYTENVWKQWNIIDHQIEFVWKVGRI